nr:C40 family peptidase [uncultured Porphyromonas sp.]
MKQLQRPYAATLLAVALFTTTACGAKAVARSTYRENSDLIASPTLAQYDQATEELQPAPTSTTKKKKSTRRKHRSKSNRSRSSVSACATQSSRHGTSGRGYSYKPITLVAGTPSLIRTVVDHGQKLLGHRYRTTGIAKWPLDCSGFVSYIYSLEGIKIPRSSGAIATYADKIKDPQPGDLLFFKGRNRGQSRVGHVAMVVSNENGQIKMMHSSCSLGIVIESYNDSPYYTSRYLGAGRLPEVASHWQGRRDSALLR